MTKQQRLKETEELKHENFALKWQLTMMTEYAMNGWAAPGMMGPPVPVYHMDEGDKNPSGADDKRDAEDEKSARNDDDDDDDENKKMAWVLRRAPGIAATMWVESSDEENQTHTAAKADLATTAHKHASDPKEHTAAKADLATTEQKLARDPTALSTVKADLATTARLYAELTDNIKHATSRADYWAAAQYLAQRTHLICQAKDAWTHADEENGAQIAEKAGPAATAHNHATTL